MKKIFRDLLSSGEKFFGTILQFYSPEAIEILSATGCRYVIIDNEHSHVTYEQTLSLLRTADSVGMPAMIRIPEISEDAIKKSLDMGFSAIRIPTVTTAGEAALAVKFSKYSPEGTRGACPFVRGNLYGTGDSRDIYRKANEDLVIAVNIEGPEGIANMEEIISLKGIDIVNVGRADLAVSLGVPGELSHPLVEKAVRDVAGLAHKYGKCSGAYIARPEDVAKYEDCPGINHFLVSPPEEILAKGYKALFDRLAAACHPAE